MLDSKGFDLWASSYDQSVANSKGYPFEGYYDVLTYVYNIIGNNVPGLKIFDIGFGTGTLTNRLYQDGSEIYGIDFSTNMVHHAKEKMPNGHFIIADFSHGLPHEILDKKFDFIISTYAIHHIDNNAKVNFFAKLKELLKPGGKIIIADVAFKSISDFKECKDRYINDWDNDEIYIVLEEIEDLFRNKRLSYKYTQISSCAGVLIID